MRKMAERLRAAPEDGFGLVEVVVSLFILALLSISFLPMLVTALKASVTNASVATANQLVNSQLELVRAISTDSRTCTMLRAALSDPSTLYTATDGNGKVLSTNRQLVVSSSTDANGCPTAVPGVVTVKVWITKPGSTAPVSQTTTYVYVKS